MGERFTHDNDVIYRTPKENKEREDDTVHTFTLEIDGEVVGEIHAIYYSKPIPFYSLDDVYVYSKYRGQGYGSHIMDSFENFLKKKKKAGVLFDGIAMLSPASGMYERRGWKKIPGMETGYAFNLPDTVPIERIAHWHKRGNSTIERQQFED